MKRITQSFFVICLTLITGTLLAQNIAYQANFDNYATGAYMAQTDGANWTTWTDKPGTAEDPTISEDQSLSPSKSLFISGTNDPILKLGNKISGKYKIEFNYFVPTGFAAYFNCLHLLPPNQQWACEVMMDKNGTGKLTAGSSTTIPFNYPKDQWFPVAFIINLTKDSATMFINNVKLSQWKFSLKATGGQGENKLAGMNFFAGAPDGQTAKFYIDNIVVTELEAPIQNPTIEVDNSAVPFQFNQANEEKTIVRQIKNTGGIDLKYKVSTTFKGYTKDDDATKDAVTLRYDTGSGQDNAIGVTGGGTLNAAVCFPASMVAKYNGMKIDSVMVRIASETQSAKLKIYNFGVVGIQGPGKLLYDQKITVSGDNPGWVPVALTEQFPVNGGDLWVGVEYKHTGGENVPAGFENGTAQPGGDWATTSSTGSGGWMKLSEVQGANLNGNWQIHVKIRGNANPVWLTATPDNGVLAPNATKDLTIKAKSTGLIPLKTYNGLVTISSNDPDHEIVDIAVTATSLIGVNDIGEKAIVSVFPNPTSKEINVNANVKIKNVTICNLIGQVIYSETVNADTFNTNVSTLKQGVYIINIETNSGKASQRFVVK